MRFSVDPWDPGYGASVEGGTLNPTTADIALSVERAPEEWAPVALPAGAAGPGAGRAPAVTLFIDGVRRVDARVWITGPDGSASPGIAASYAAGVVRCDGTATVAGVVSGRGLFTASPHAAPIATRAGEFAVTMAAGDTPEALSLALQDRMGQAEIAAAEQALVDLAGEKALVVIDGPLRGRQHLPGAVGLVKTHHVQYLPDAQHALVGRLGPGERTPVFTMRTAWARHSWYLRLPAGGSADVTSSPWAGVVRCEAAVDLTPAEAVALADVTAMVLPRFASARHKDTRAPQNLYPVGGLERELRRRLGDQQVVYRALLRAAA